MFGHPYNATAAASLQCHDIFSGHLGLGPPDKAPSWEPAFCPAKVVPDARRSAGPRIPGMQDNDQERLIQLSRARNTVDEIEQLCAKSALLTARAEELLAGLRILRPEDHGPDSLRP